MKKRRVQTPEDIAKSIQDAIDRGKRELQEDIKKGFIPKDATRSFEIGQRIKYGAHEHSVVVEKDDTGLLYLVRSKNGKKESKFEDFSTWLAWIDIYPYREVSEMMKIPQFASRDDMRLQFHQSTLNSFESIVYGFGLDLNPDYQRGLVWEIEDRVKLIDSIFKGIDIGKFVFIRRDFGHNGALFEILDGKQRLSAIMDFKEDRFSFNGLLYSELHPHDQSYFDSYSIAKAEVSNPTKEQIYRYFLRLNTGGKPVSLYHLQRVEKLLSDEQEKGS